MDISALSSSEAESIGDGFDEFMDASFSESDSAAGPAEAAAAPAKLYPWQTMKPAFGSAASDPPSTAAGAQANSSRMTASGSASASASAATVPDTSSSMSKWLKPAPSVDPDPPVPSAAAAPSRSLSVSSSGSSSAAPSIDLSFSDGGSDGRHAPLPTAPPTLPATVVPPTPITNPARWSGDRDSARSPSPEVSMIASQSGPFGGAGTADAATPPSNSDARSRSKSGTRSETRSRSPTPLTNKLDELHALGLLDSDDEESEARAKAEFFARQESEGPIDYAAALMDASAADTDSALSESIAVPQGSSLAPTLSATPVRAPGPARPSTTHGLGARADDNARTVAELKAELSRVYTQVADAQEASVQARAALARHEREAARAARMAQDKANATIKGLKDEIERLRPAGPREAVLEHGASAVAGLSPEQVQDLVASVKEQEALIAGFQHENEKLCREIKVLKASRKPGLSREPRPVVRDESPSVPLAKHNAVLARLDKVQAEAKAAAAAAAAREAKLLGKLRWYEENQELLDARDAELAAAQETIAELKQQGAGDRGSSSVAADKARIKELERQVASMDEVIRSRYPDSITELIRATAPSADDNETIAYLRGELGRLNTAFDAAQDKHSRDLRVLRQKHEKTRAAYERELALARGLDPEDDSFEAVSPPRRGSTSPPGSSARVQELERTLANVRSLYQRKLKDAEGKIARLEAGRGRPRPRPGHGGPNVRALKARVARLEEALDKAHATIDTLSQAGRTEVLEDSMAELKELNARLAREAEAARSTAEALAAEKAGLLEGHARETEALVAAHDKAMDALLARIGGTDAWVSKAPATPVKRTFPAATAEAGPARDKENAINLPPPPPPIGTPAAQRKLTSHVIARIEALEAELTAPVRTRPALVAAPLPADEVSAALDMYRGKVSQLQSSLALAHTRIAELEEANAELRIEASKLRSSPAVTDIAKLARKIEDMEKRHMLRELELESVIEDTKSSAQLDLALAKKAHATQLAAKNAEIATFQHELDDLLGTINVLRQAIVS